MRSPSITVIAATVFGAGAMLSATSAAYARPDTRAMTCAQTQAMVETHHAVVLTTGVDTYDRFVRQFGNECDWPEVPVSTTAPTKDGECRVYRCEEPISLPD